MLALILVDLQNDFLPGGALAVPNGDQVLPVAAQLSAQFDIVVATQDWHPSDHQSFASQHDQPIGTLTELDGLPQVLWPDHCVMDSRGAAFADGVAMDRISKVFRKGSDPRIDSYSGFYDNGHRRSTGMGAWLRDQGVRLAFVMGLATDYCVKFTALDAVREGFDTWVIDDGCRAVNLQPTDEAQAYDAMQSAGVQRIDSATLLDCLPALREDESATSSYETKVLERRRYLQLVERGHWEYAERPDVMGAVALIAVTPDDKLLLVEQHRLPHGRRVIELPAGIVGDEPSAVPEDPASAAARELLEETGYQAGSLRYLTHGPTSAGMSSEAVIFFGACDLKRVADGGGVGREQIRVHEVPLDQAYGWVQAQTRRGVLVDPKVFAGCYLASRMSG